MNLFNGLLEKNNGQPVLKVGSQLLSLPNADTGLRTTGAVILGVRPEHLTIAATGWAMKVLMVEMLGAERLVYVQLVDGPSDQTYIVRIDESQAIPAVGQSIHVQARSDRLHWFDVKTGKRIE